MIEERLMKSLKALVTILALLAFSITAIAQNNYLENYQWPDEQPLPKWKTPEEKLVPQEPTDEVTPPPTEPVRAVAEFEPQEGIQVVYPYGSTNWNDIFVEIVRECQEVGVVYVVVPGTAALSTCTNLLSFNGVPLDNIEFIFHAIDGNWSRDYGPHFVWGETSGEIALVDWQYYDSRPNDDEIPDYMADIWHMNFYETALYHEGGNYMSDGHGTVMCSDVLYNDNPWLTHEQCEQEVIDYYGANEVYVYESIIWDMTGHIDLWGKMVNDSTILVAQMQPDDPNYNLVEQHAARMGMVQTVYGTAFNIVRVPMPASYTWPWHYYKSYINSVIFNGKVLVPIAEDNPTMNQEALDAYQSAMPDYEIVGIYCDAICPAGGAIHCTTIGIADHIEDYVYDATVTATPVSAPVQIPAEGGSFDFDIELINNETDSIFTELWSNITSPSGDTSGVILDSSLALSGSETVLLTLTQEIPAGAPEGTYTYTVFTGERLPRVLNDESSFTFEKLDVVGIISEDPESLLSDLVLLEAYPNPFNPITNITFNLPEEGYVELTVYNTNGIRVAELATGYMETGTHQAIFDASDLASGIYLVKLQCAGNTAMQKLVLVK